MLTKAFPTALLAAFLIIPGVGFAGDSMLQTDTILDRNWGRSFERAKHHQIMNPEAEKNLSPVTGIEGPVGERIMKNYVKGSQRKKSSSKEFTILTTK